MAVMTTGLCHGKREDNNQGDCDNDAMKRHGQPPEMGGSNNTRIKCNNYASGKTPFFRELGGLLERGYMVWIYKIDMKVLIRNFTRQKEAIYKRNG